MAPHSTPSASPTQDRDRARSASAVMGLPRLILRAEGAAALLAGTVIYGSFDGDWLWFLPLLLLVDVSMAGYLAGPRAGAVVYDIAHNWALGLAVLGLGALTGVVGLVLAGAILVAHTGMDRLVGYGLKYPTGFQDTHLGRIGRAPSAPAAAVATS